MPTPFRLFLILLGTAWGLCGAAAQAHEAGALLPVPMPEPLRVYGELPALPGVADIKFGEFFKLPIGPRGLELSSRLRSLHDRTVRLVGYMARQDSPSDGLFILAPLPVQMGDDDDTFADDLPASAVFVRLAPAQGAVRLPFMPGLMALTGTLQVGPVEEADGRVSTVRLLLSDTQSRTLADALKPQPHAAAAPARP